MTQHDLDTLIDQVADRILDAKRIVVFTGAGVSTESGIPDFRSLVASGTSLTLKISLIRSSSVTLKAGKSIGRCFS